MNRRTIPLALALLALAHGAFAAARARPVPRPALRDRLANGPELYGIVHWGLNTYTDREWGYGDEDPKLLAPAAFDADQIVGACRDGGLEGLIVVAKHHDGFCLWPTKTTAHSIARAPFRDGRGDYVREMAEACRRAGLAFGVYVSPWDRNSAHYGTERYVEIYHAQIRELLSGGYGEVFEMWFDGANGGDGWYGGARERRSISAGYYRFDEVFAFVRALQPNVCIFAGESDLSDFRWPGNERGELGDDSRATIASVGGFANGEYGNPDYAYQINCGQPSGAYFRPCEADFPLRRGWFFHERERGTTKSPAFLLKAYLRTVGNGGTMNLGIAPDRDGRLDAEDVRALKGFAALKAAFFAHEVSGDGQPFNAVVLSEDLSRGEQVDHWTLQGDGAWLATGRAIGRRRIRLLDRTVAPRKVELHVTADGGDRQAVSIRRYLVPDSVLAALRNATGDGRETDTAKWMTRPAVGADAARKAEELVDCPVSENLRGHENVEWSIGYGFGFVDTPDLPRVLLVGDSICNGYQEGVREGLKGEANVSYWISSYCVTSPGYLKRLALHLDEATYSVIHFNNGLHSLETDVGDWERGLEAALRLIRLKQPQAKVVWASSTPLRDPAKTEKARRLNAAAQRVVARLGGIGTNDLFTPMDGLDRETEWSDTYHFKAAAKALQAQLVIQAIR